MAEVGNEMTFTNEKGEVDYHVQIPEGDYLLVAASVERGGSATNFDHPNILQTRRQILSIKGYWPNGHKRWYEKPGVSFLFAIPKDKIEMIQERGYSYVPVSIGGHKFNISCSGGSFNGWTDFLTHGCSVGIFRAKKGLQILADNSIVPGDIDLGPVKMMDEHEQALYSRLCAYHDTKGKLREGDRIVLGSSYHVEDSKGPFLIVRRPKRKRHFIVDSGCFKTKVFYKHIDWERTAEINGVSLVS